jgi:hypothetical protein
VGVVGLGADVQAAVVVAKVDAEVTAAEVAAGIAVIVTASESRKAKGSSRDRWITATAMVARTSGNNSAGAFPGAMWLRSWNL